MQKKSWVARSVLVLLISLSPTVSALEVIPYACPELDVQEVERLVGIELAPYTDDESLQISLICEGQTLHIQATRANAPETIERTVALVDSHLKERLVALTVSQLVTRATAQPPPSPPARRQLSAASPPPLERRTRSLSFCVSGGVKPHAAFSAPTGYAALRSGTWFNDKVALVWWLGLEGGRLERAIGRIKVLSGLGGVGAAWRFASFRYVSMALFGGAFMGYTRLKGEPLPNSGAGTVGGVAGEFVVGLSPLVITGRFLVALDILGGYTIENPTGTVDGDQPVTLGGFWVGGGLRLGIQT